MSGGVDIYSAIFLSAVLIVASVNDLRFQKIPNLLTYPAMAVALVYHFVMNGLNGLLFSAVGLALGIAILIIPYLMGRYTRRQRSIHCLFVYRHYRRSLRADSSFNKASTF